MKTIIEFIIFLKDLLLEYVKNRIFPVTVAFIVMFSILISQLFQLQIVNSEQYRSNFSVKTEKTITVSAIRGKIFDVKGNLLAYNDIAYNLTLENSAALSSTAREMGITSNELLNRIIFQAVSILKTNGDKLSITFPVSYKNGRYEFNVSGTSLKNFKREVYAATSYDNLTEEQKNSTAEEIVNYLRYGTDEVKNFQILDEFSDAEAMEILACRYELWLNRYKQYVSVVIADNISVKSKNQIQEHKDSLLGMDISVTSKRVYNDAVYFAPIIGYVGEATSKEIDVLNQNDESNITYKAGDVVGKAGIEATMETTLHGTDGKEIVNVDNLGKVIETLQETSAKAGDDVYLTIDSDLQKYCYDILEEELASILCANIVNMAEVIDGGEIKSNVIAITDVYYAFFNNNIIDKAALNAADATPLERSVYNLSIDYRKYAISTLRSLLLVEPLDNNELSSSYKLFLERFYDMLVEEKIIISSAIEPDDSMFTQYANGTISFAELLKYLISIEAVDISVINEDSSYYDADETYTIICEHLLDQAVTDNEFNNLVFKAMMLSGEMTGLDVIHLLYDQGILNEKGDTDYQDLQAGAISAYNFMLTKISKLEITPAQLALTPCSGALVVTDVHTGEVRALVNYPSYDNNMLTNSIDPDYYNMLLSDKTSPLYSRATMTRTAPGSTFKIITTVAGVSEGVLGIDEQITDFGEFDKVYTKPKCWIYRQNNGATHGTIGISRALDISCNYFYYEVGYRLGTKTGEYVDSAGLAYLRKYAEQFGLGERSGVEIDEVAPNISDLDVVTSAIGQGKHAYTPTQLSRYITTVANRGTCYDLTLISKTTDYSGEVKMVHEPHVKDTLTLDNRLWDTIYYGLRLVVTDDLRDNKLLNQINVEVSGKTGTAQENTKLPAHALFLSFAPSNDPEVSVTAVIQNGYSSGNAAELASFVYAYMYDKEALAHATFSGDTSVSD